MFEIYFTASAQAALSGLEKNRAKTGLVKQIKKAIYYLQQNPRHPSLKTHAYDSVPHPFSKQEKVFGAYAQNNTPSAYRIFWCYGPGTRQITVIAVTEHP